MGFDKEAAQKVLAEIDRNELAQLGCDLTSIPSPTGHEKAIAEFILAWFEKSGLKAVRQDVEVDRVIAKAAQLYALMALDICSRGRPAPLPK